jgi:DNA-binding NarL/FixJ family response regulator
MYGNEEYYSKMVELGVKGYLLKSCHIDEFEKAIKEVMKGSNYFFTDITKKDIKHKKYKEVDKILSEDSDLTITEIKLIQNIYSKS